MATADGPRIGRRAQPGESVSPFLTLLRSSDLFLRAEFARSSVLKQATTKGTVRETAVRPLARQLFPRRYEITSGEVMNIAGETSKAQDLIIYEPDLTAGWHVPDTNAVLPAESVLATVEVKSRATKSQIERTVENLASVKHVFGHRPRSGLAGDLLIDETVATGAELLEAFPVVSLSGNLTLGVAALSYNGALNLGVTADADACPDVGVFVSGVERAFAQLGAIPTAARRVGGAGVTVAT